MQILTYQTGSIPLGLSVTWRLRGGYVIPVFTDWVETLKPATMTVALQLSAGEPARVRVRVGGRVRVRDRVGVGVRARARARVGMRVRAARARYRG